MGLVPNYYALLACICQRVKTNDALIAFGLRANSSAGKKCTKK